MTNDETPSPWGKRPGSGKRNPAPGPVGKGPSSGSGGYVKWIIAALVAVLLLVWFFPNGSSFGDRGPSILYDVFWLMLIGSALLTHVMSEPGKALRQMAAWVIIFGVFMVGYSLWSGTGRLASELDPAKGFGEKDSISYRVDGRGHFIVRAEVNGVDIRFLLDTGASDVALSARDAERIGFDLDRLTYNKPYNTANGVTFAAPVLLDEITLGPIRAYNIEASISREGLENSLLGMSFLNSLSGYKVEDGVLTLFP